MLSFGALSWKVPIHSTLQGYPLAIHHCINMVEFIEAFSTVNKLATTLENAVHIVIVVTQHRRSTNSIIDHKRDSCQIQNEQNRRQQ
jgi:adenosine/AMP kinase